jgi:cellulose synthase/poly-beta-1,6-N-acetylglucosamine synthase-like glycosyltransferase
MWLSLLFATVAAIFLLMTGGTLFHLRWVRRLPSTAALDDRGETTASVPVSCSVVIAARDEAARIERTVQHLLAQTGVTVEVIVVDDRSTDGTGRILRRLAADDHRVRPARVDVLPDGWLGKCHACHVGAGMATGDWILFTDADCWLEPDVIRRAVRVAHREGVEHITLTPGNAPTTLAARAWHLAFIMSVANWISGVNRDKPRAYLGMGAFNLVRLPAYRDCGGYQALRLTVLDDMRLGLLLRRAGKRTRAFIGGDDAACHWGTTVPDMIAVMEKNYFAAINFNLAIALLVGLGGPLLWLLAVAGPFTGTPAGWAAGLAMSLFMLPAASVARRLRWSWPSAVVTPIVYPALFYAVLNSALTTTRQGGIRWRDTFYPLDRLRSGAVR